MRVFRRVAAFLAGAVLAGAVAACAPDNSGPVTYSPAAYGQVVNNVNECYYINSPQEAYSLIAAGLCPQGAIPTIMPLSWEQEYWSYYSSPAYYNAYVPAAYRGSYVNVTIVRFSQTYSSQIRTASTRAVYKSSSGGTVSGSRVNTTQFGSGSRTQQSYGGGARNGGSNNNASVPQSSRYGGGSRSGFSSAGRH